MPGKSRLANGARHLALIGGHAFALGEDTPRSPIRIRYAIVRPRQATVPQGDRHELVFSDAESVGPLFPGAVRLATQLHPTLPIVGYERGASLIDAERAGFEPLRGLTVWDR